MRVVQLAAAETTTGAKTAATIVGSVRENFSAYLKGTGTFSVDFEGSFDGTNWVKIVTAKTANEVFLLPATPYVRINCVTMTGASVDAFVGV